eukprot:TRINITY_DN24147_c0_g1_i1.p1 TRINITY_DN24147_c0_g1~~TRINITY_DN24147_c0_g1_i1.p1  ORF type:complete len:107 (-),score=3.47 TRINITY_DN24147_c0_g1_i1:265-585(-)
MPFNVTYTHPSTFKEYVGSGTYGFANDWSEQGESSLADCESKRQMIHDYGAITMECNHVNEWAQEHRGSKFWLMCGNVSETDKDYMCCDTNANENGNYVVKTYTFA